MTTTHQTEQSATRGLPPAYRPQDHETRIRKRWEAARAFHADPNRVLSGEKDPYCVLIPPPNVTGALHLGHALNNTLQDILVRMKRMQGFEVLWMPGTDHAGIATQTVVEKRILAEGGKPRIQWDRDEFIAKVREWKDEYQARITNQLTLMGSSCDWDRQRFTMDDVCAKAVREAFFQLFKASLIYRGKRLVNWDPVTQTALADDEVEMVEVEGKFYYMRYPLCDETGAVTAATLPDGSVVDHVTVATTRPETYLGDTAVAVNPKDPRAEALRGLYVKLPIVGRKIQIIEDDYVVLPDPDGSDPKAKYATGFLKVTPAHDENDWLIGQRNDLEVINVLAPDATISDQHGWDNVGEAAIFVGLSREDARKRVVAEFEKLGLLEDVKPYSHSVGHSYRSHAAIEPYLSDQWYVKVTDDRLAGAAQRAIVKEQQTGHSKWLKDNHSEGDGAIAFHPDRYARTYEGWHENLRDWCVSRQLWWGHRIPVWTTMQAWILSGVRGKGKARLSQEDARRFLAYRNKIQLWQKEERIHFLPELDGGRIDAVSEPLVAGDPDRFICVRNPQDSEVISFLEDHTYAQDPDVLDTWFSSALWPLSTMGWPDPTQDEQFAGMLDAFKPTSVLCTARDIITLWVSRMVMFNRFFECGQIPFSDVYIHPVIQDGDGKRMSKSAGNGVDPLDIISTHGADAMRYTLCQLASQTQDVRLPVEHDKATGKNTSPKFDLGKRFCNKLWNASRFTLMMLAEAQPPCDDERDARLTDECSAAARPTDQDATDLSFIDRWMLSRLTGAVERIETALAKYEFNTYAEALYDIVWNDFCDWHLEAIKPTVKENPTQQAVLRTVLDCLLRLLHPVAPFVTEAIYEELLASPHCASIAGVDLIGTDGRDARSTADIPNRRDARSTADIPNRQDARSTADIPDRRDARSTADIPDGQDARSTEQVVSGGLEKNLLCLAPWPKLDPALRDEKLESRFSHLQELARMIRDVRSKQKAPPKKRITLHTTPELADRIAEAQGIVETLTHLEAVTTDAPAGASTSFTFEGVEHRLSGLADEVDPAVERERLTRSLGEADEAIALLEKRMSNPGYVDKAPAKLVQQTRDQLDGKKAERDAIARSLESLA